MITGAHIMLQSSNDAADKAFFKEILKLPSVGAGDEFVIFGMPPTELAVHSGANGAHKLFLMCDDIEAFVASMDKRGLRTTNPQNRGWGLITELTLPGGGKVEVYQPRYKRPKQPAAKIAASARPTRKSAKRTASKRKATTTRGKKAGAKRGRR